MADTELKFPKGEIVWTQYLDEKRNLRFIVTSKPMQDTYFLYELKDGKFVKLGKASDPVELEKTYHVNKTINMSLE